MKNYALVLVAALTVLLGTSTAIAGELFIDEYCEKVDCELPSWVRNTHKLTKAETIALHQYTLGYYQEINPALVRGNLNKLQTEFVQVLDSALKKIPSQKALVYRGTSQRKEIQKGDEGKLITLPTYTSTTTEREDAEGFIRDCLMIIKVSSGKNIMSYANAPNEDEILLPRGTQLRVDKVEMKKINIFTDEGPEDRLVQIVELTQI